MQHERGRVQVMSIRQYAKSFAKGIYVQSCIYLRMRNGVNGNARKKKGQYKRDMVYDSNMKWVNWGMGKRVKET